MAGLKDIPDIQISSLPGHFTFCATWPNRIRDFVISDSGFLREIIKRYERITTFLKIPLYFLHFQKPAGIPTAHTICLSGIFKTYFCLVSSVSTSYTPMQVATIPPGRNSLNYKPADFDMRTFSLSSSVRNYLFLLSYVNTDRAVKNVITMPPRKDSPNYKLTDFDMHTLSLSSLVRNYLFLPSYVNTDRAVKNVITMPFGKDPGVHRLTDLSMRTRSRPSLFGNYLYPAKLISAYYRVRNMISAPSGRDSRIYELTVPNIHWFAKISLLPTARPSSIEKTMPEIHRPKYHYDELSHSLRPVLAEFILSSHADNYNRKTSQLEKVAPALTQPFAEFMSFAKHFSLKGGVLRKDARLHADRMLGTKGFPFTTTKDVYFSKLVATRPVPDYVGSKKELRSNPLVSTQARLLNGEVGSNVKSETILGLIPKQAPGDSISGANNKVLRHNFVENRIFIRHKRFVDNSQNARAEITQKHFDPDFPYIRQGSSPAMYATDSPAMVYLVPGTLNKSATAVKTTEKDVKREASSSVPPPFTDPQMLSSTPVAESDLPRLANRVYGLIVERIGREKELGGY